MGNVSTVHGHGLRGWQRQDAPLFADIDVHMQQYTFSHPAGLPFVTQFALVMTEKAAFEDMHIKGFVQNDCACAGHSWGDYSALASIADVLRIFALVDVVFYCGITMQCAVERDSENRLNYATFKTQWDMGVANAELTKWPSDH
jgi:fatty acid synthase subunit alpha, fungi type